MCTERWLLAKPARRPAPARLGGAALVLFLWAAAGGGTSAPGDGADRPSRQPVRIQSEQLVAEMEADTAEFSGAVRVEGDGYTVTADYLTIQFKPGTASRNPSPGMIAAEEVARMTARGRVRIRAEAITASAEQAVYEPDSGQLWLLAADAPPPARPARGGPPAGAAGSRNAPPAPRPPASRVQVVLTPPAGG